LLDTLITSKTRIRLLLKFFLNSKTTSYLRDLEGELGESTNAIRVELNRLEAAGLLEAHRDGNKKIYRANSSHPLFSDIRSILMKHTGIDQVVERVVQMLGGLERAYVLGSFARGHDDDCIELLLSGRNIDEAYLDQLTKLAQKTIDRQVRYIIIDPDHLTVVLKKHPEALLLWKA
jgi:DNA-binding transcriptional ArsR family regulator